MKKLRRYAVYFLGMFSLALSAILNAKSGIGMGPVNAFPFSVSLVIGVNFPNAIMVTFVVYFLIEELIKFRRAKWYDILQLPFSVLFTRTMSFLSGLIPDIHSRATGYFMLIFVIITGAIGVTLIVEMRIVPNPADGLVQAISDRTGMKLGLTKNLFDLLSVVLAVILEFAVLHQFTVIGLGTVILTFSIGRVVALIKKKYGWWLEKVYREATEKPDEAM